MASVAMRALLVFLLCSPLAGRSHESFRGAVRESPWIPFHPRAGLHSTVDSGANSKQTRDRRLSLKLVSNITELNVNQWLQLDSSEETMPPFGRFSVTIDRRLNQLGYFPASLTMTPLYLDKQRLLGLVAVAGSDLSGDEAEGWMSVARTWLYHPENRFWQLQVRSGSSDPMLARCGHSLVSEPSLSLAILYGGMDAKTCRVAFHQAVLGERPQQVSTLNDIWVFNSSDLQWRTKRANASVSSLKRQPGRAGHSAVVLKTASLPTSLLMLVFGGYTDGLGNVTNDLLEINIGDGQPTWHKVEQSGDWPTARAGHSAVITSDNTMLVFGGYFRDSSTASPVQLIDLWAYTTDNGWSRLADFPLYDDDKLNGCNIEFSGVYHRDGDSLLVAGSPQCSWLVYAGPQLWHYDRNEGVWLHLHPASAPVEPLGFALTSISAMGDVSITAMTSLWDGSDHTWIVRYNKKTQPEGLWLSADQQVTPCPVQRFGASFTLDEYQEMAFSFGGGMQSSTMQTLNFTLSTNEVWMFDLSRHRWKPLRAATEQHAPQPRLGHQTTLWQDNLIVFGGLYPFGKPNNFLDDLWCFSLKNNSWIRPELPGNGTPPARAFGASVNIKYGLFLHGGLTKSNGSYKVHSDSWAFLKTNFSFSGDDNPWNKISSDYQPQLFGHTITTVGKKLVVFGGAVVSDDVVHLQMSFWHVEVDDHDSTCQWKDMSGSVFKYNWPSPRMFHTATTINSEIVVVGGCAPDDCAIDFLVDCCEQTAIPIDHVWLFTANESSRTGPKWLRVPMERPPSELGLAMHSAFVMNPSLLVITAGLEGSSPLMPPADGGMMTVREHQVTMLCARLSCPAGTSSPELDNELNCNLCPPNKYSNRAGSKTCSPCPELTQTNTTGGATDVSQCTMCSDEACHGHGTCAVRRPDLSVACHCQFGFLTMDNCRLPWIYFGIGFGICVCLIVFLGLGRGCHKWQKQKHHFRLLQNASQVELANLAHHWRISSKELILQRRLHQGVLGDVWLGLYYGIEVAVRRLQAVHCFTRGQTELEQHAKEIRALRHPNIVLTIGVGLQAGQPFYVMEYMHLGPLRAVLEDDSIHIDHSKVLRIAADVARGMRYLHNQELPLVHGKLDGEAIFLSSCWAAKVSFFNMSTLVAGLRSRLPPQPVTESFESGLEELSPLLLPETDEPSSDVAYQSPEALAGTVCGQSSDVYSFGMVLWTLHCRGSPFSLECKQPAFNLLHAIATGQRPGIPNHCPASFAHLIMECWCNEAEQRPSFVEIVQQLDEQSESCYEQVGNAATGELTAAELTSIRDRTSSINT